MLVIVIRTDTSNQSRRSHRKVLMWNHQVIFVPQFPLSKDGVGHRFGVGLSFQVGLAGWRRAAENRSRRTLASVAARLAFSILAKWHRAIMPYGLSRISILPQARARDVGSGRRV